MGVPVTGSAAIPWGPDRVEPFLDGLLPDNQAARGPDAMDELDEGALVPMSGSGIGMRLRDLISSRQPSRQAHGEHWSLAGAQEKIALHRRADQWYQATGAIPTTHIIKPGVPIYVDFAGTPEVEVQCRRVLTWFA